MGKSKKLIKNISIVISSIILIIGTLIAIFLYRFHTKNIYESPYENCIIKEGSRFYYYGIEVNIIAINNEISYKLKMPDELAKVEHIKWCERYVYVYLDGSIDNFPSIYRYNLNKKEVKYLGYKREKWKEITCPSNK